MTIIAHPVRHALRSIRPRWIIAAAVGVAALLLSTDGVSALEFLKHASDSATVNAIEVKGKVEPGDSVALQTYIAKLPAKSLTVVYLNSPGGSFDEGMALGRLFYRSKIRTAVIGKGVVCSSACTSAFLGGRDPKTGEPWRAKGSTALLGFHSFRITWADRDYTAQDMSVAIARTQRMTLAMADYMTEVGASLEFLRAHLKSPAAGMSYMSNDEVLSLGVYVIDDRTGELIVPEPLKIRQH
jgi:hypothetical protein